MGKFDEAWKRFFSDPARFADIVNVYCHEGRQVIKAEDIRDADSAQGSCMRDTVRKIVSGQEIMICGIERQEDMDPSMAWRVMGYDYREYEKQIRSIRKRNIQLFAKNGSNHQGSHSQGATDVFVSRDKVQGISDIPAKSEKEITSGEYMRKFLKTDRLRPVGTIIIYSGGKWDGPNVI